LVDGGKKRELAFGWKRPRGLDQTRKARKDKSFDVFLSGFIPPVFFPLHFE
jgi:hypothetical protein